MFLREKMTSNVIAAHQPNFIPYLGFFDKMKKSDVFVIRDEVLFVDKEFHNRNRIRVNSNDSKDMKFSWISAPVENPRDYILHAKIKKDVKKKNMHWKRYLLREIKLNYQGTRYFDKYFLEFEKLFTEDEESLLNLNMKIINFFKEAFGIKTEVVYASELGLKGKNNEKSDASEDLAKICKSLGGDVYLSGSGGKKYLDLKPFVERGIKVEFQDFKSPKYEQKYPGFLPDMCALDALFCVGPEVLDRSEQVVLPEAR
jgi:hypothetical protein